MAKKYITPQVRLLDYAKEFCLQEAPVEGSIPTVSEPVVGITNGGRASGSFWANSKKRNAIVDMGSDDDEW